MFSRLIFSKFTNTTTFLRRRLSSAQPDVPLTYSTGVQAMHWLMGGSMLASVGLVLSAQNTKDKKLKGQYMYYHKSFGTLAFFLLGPRIVIRYLSKVPGPVQGISGVEHSVSLLGHAVMYGFAFFLPVSGVVMGFYGGYGIPFFFTTISSGTKDPAIANKAYENHKIAGKVFEYLVPLHVGASFLHFFRGQVIFARIIPGLKATK